MKRILKRALIPVLVLGGVAAIVAPVITSCKSSKAKVEIESLTATQDEVVFDFEVSGQLSTDEYTVTGTTTKDNKEVNADESNIGPNAEHWQASISNSAMGGDSKELSGQILWQNTLANPAPKSYNVNIWFRCLDMSSMKIVSVFSYNLEITSR